MRVNLRARGQDRAGLLVISKLDSGVGWKG
jgi:hypothetical protein